MQKQRNYKFYEAGSIVSAYWAAGLIASVAQVLVGVNAIGVGIFANLQCAFLIVAGLIQLACLGLLYSKWERRVNGKPVRDFGQLSNLSIYEKWPCIELIGIHLVLSILVFIVLARAYFPIENAESHRPVGVAAREIHEFPQFILIAVGPISILVGIFLLVRGFVCKLGRFRRFGSA